MTNEVQNQEELSEMEKIRLRSVSPEFFKECKVVTDNIWCDRCEAEYREFLAARGITADNEREAARKGFEKYCKNYKPEEI